jgi:hypothetical protein
MTFGVRGGLAPVHPVKIYEDDDGLAEAVAGFVAEGVRLGETVVVVSTPGHWKAFADRLRNLGIDPDDGAKAGQLTFLDARATLSRFMTAEAPDRARFEEVIIKAMDAASAWRPQAPLRAYGEMVDLLWQEGRLEAAMRLEACWQGLMRKRPFSLMCGYKVSVLDKFEDAAALERICACHTALIPAFDPARLEAAVDRAIEAELGGARAGLLRPLIAANVPPAGLGPAERGILWVRKNFPDEAQSILERARRIYERGA